MSEQTFTIHIPKTEWMTSNQRDHRAVKDQKIRALRTRSETLFQKYLREGRATKPEGRVHFTVTAIYRAGVGLDDDNCQPSFKAVRDGMVNAGLIDGDDRKHVTHTTYMASVKEPRIMTGWHALQITMTDEKESQNHE